MAHMSNCARLKDAFINGQDIHRATATQIFELPEDKITDEQRQVAKGINFSVIYGMSYRRLSKKLGMSQQRTYDLYSKYIRLYHEVFCYLEGQEKFAEKNGYVETLFGRKCYTPLINSPQKRMVGFAKRQAVNAPIQGSNADIIKMAMVKLNEVSPNLNMLLQIHDELIFEIPNEKIDETIRFIKDLMENIVKLSVPMIVDVEVGNHL